MAPVVNKAKSKHKFSHRDIKELHFDVSHMREIEQRRNTGQISCAECKRLRVKCDKQIPCQSCQRRGCASLCPNGSLATGQGTRFVLAATEDLHRRSEKLGERIQQLEDALGKLQAKHSTEPHPILLPDRGNQRDMNVPPQPEEPTLSDQLREPEDHSGTMSITDQGISRFFGPTAGSYCLWMKNNPEDGVDDSTRDVERLKLPPAIRMLTQGFPLSIGNVAPSARHLIQYLPPWDRAISLIEIYLEQAGWMFQSVTREQVMNELLPDNYSKGMPAPAQHTNLHRLGLLFLVFAIGTLLGLRDDPENTDAVLFHQCTRATIGLQSVVENPSLETLQILHLLGVYNGFSGNELAGKETTVETTWYLASLPAHLSQTIGLHRDSSRWDLPSYIIQRRRLLFWDLFVADTWQSLYLGRPPAFSLSYVNCKYPDGSTLHEAREVGKQPAVETWTFRFTAECVTEVILKTLSADLPRYSSIMELDRKVREFGVPDAVTEFLAATSGAVPPKLDKSMGPGMSMGRFVMSNARDVILLYLHRSYFAQAVTENSANPLTTIYAPSFLAAYRASVTILRTTIAQFNSYDVLVARFWMIWTYTFSASVVFGTIVTRGPRSSMASSAMKDLHDAWQLFSKGASLSRMAQKALPYVSRLRETARNALIQVHSGLPPELGENRGKGENEGPDDLAIFAGHSKLVERRRADKIIASSSPKSDGAGRQASPNPDPSEHMSAPTSYESNPTMSIGADSSAYSAEVQPYLPEIQSQGKLSCHPYSSARSTIMPLSQYSMQAEHSFHPHSAQLAWSATPTPASTNLYGLPDVASHSQHYLSQASYDAPPPVYYGDGAMEASLVPPDLTHIGPITQESTLGQSWTSLMRDYGYFEG